MSLFDTVPL